MTRATLRSFIPYTLLLTGAAVLAGCAEPMTYSQDFKREGLRQYNRGQYVDAAGTFKAAAKQDPTDYQTQYYLAMSQEKNGEFQTAVGAYRLCLKLRVQTPAGRQDVELREKVLNHMAALIARGDFADAEINDIQHEAAAEHSSEDYRLLARVFALRGDADSAVDSYRRGFTEVPDDFMLAKEYGLYLLKINQTADGIRILKLAWQLNGYDRQVVTTLAALGVTENQMWVSSTKIESEPPSTPQTAWEVDTTPRD
jgi:Tfp pilus assembly protein PilF